LPTAPVAAQGYDPLFSQIMSRPDDPALNKQFARQAEARGDLRHALAALERVVTSSPGDTEAQAEYDRIKKKILPAVTKVTVEIGASYASNPRHMPSSAQRPSDGTYDARVAVADERTLLGQRWRTRAFAGAQLQGQITELDTAVIAAETGPVFQLTPKLWMHLAGGGGVTWLDQRKLYDDITASVTVGGLYLGLTQQVTARYTWRNGNFADFGANDAQIFDLEGRFVFSPMAAMDLLYLVPRVAVSQADGSAIKSVTVPGFGFDFSRPLFPGDYVEVGGRVAYYYPIAMGRAFVGAGFAAYRRSYDENVSNVVSMTPTDNKRADTYIEPTAHLIFPNLIAPMVDLRFDYRYERNFSNDPSVEYENHVAGTRIVGRF
jgi:hypothetical protein